jgi:hypothetical protein
LEPRNRPPTIILTAHCKITTSTRRPPQGKPCANYLSSLYTIYGVWRNSLTHLFSLGHEKSSQAIVRKEFTQCQKIFSKRNRAHGNRAQIRLTVFHGSREIPQWMV